MSQIFLPSDDTLTNTLLWFEEARPQPSEKDINVQMGVHFEEVGEMLDELTGDNPVTSGLIGKANEAIKALAAHMKQTGAGVSVLPENRINFLDAIVDQLVTATGTAQHLGMMPVAGLAVVNLSNWSKFVDGKAIFDENGKIAKGPDYHKADLSSFV